MTMDYEGAAQLRSSRHKPEDWGNTLAVSREDQKRQTSIVQSWCTRGKAEVTGTSPLPAV